MPRRSVRVRSGSVYSSSVCFKTSPIVQYFAGHHMHKFLLLRGSNEDKRRRATANELMVVFKAVNREDKRSRR